MTWGIIGALQQEVALIKEQMTLEKTVTLYNADYYIGTIGRQRVVAVCCSIGKVNAAACAGTVIREFGADRVINVGIAGAAGGGLRTLDVAVSETAAFHDQDPELFARYYPYQKAYSADASLIGLCIQAMDSLENRSFRYQTGLIATGDVFVSDPVVKADICRRLAPLCVEMEGAAIAQIATMNATPFLIIRTMSDNADEEAEETYDNLLERAAETSAKIVLTMLSLAE